LRIDEIGDPYKNDTERVIRVTQGDTVRTHLSKGLKGLYQRREIWFEGDKEGIEFIQNCPNGRFGGEFFGYTDLSKFLEEARYVFRINEWGLQGNEELNRNDLIWEVLLLKVDYHMITEDIDLIHGLMRQIESLTVTRNNNITRVLECWWD